MITGILDHLRAFLNRKPSRFPPGESEQKMTTEEHAALMNALNPDYRLYIRIESGRFVDVGWDEERGRSQRPNARENSEPFIMKIEEP